MKSDRRTEKWNNQQASAAEAAKLDVVVDPVAEGERRYRELLTGPDAPAWARVQVNPEFQPGPASTTDVAAKLAALEQEHAAALANLNRVQEEQRAALNTQLAQQREAEEQSAKNAASELPSRLKSTLETIRSFVPTAPAAPAPVSVDDLIIRRGQAALARSLRRANGEDVPEPDEAPLPNSVPGAPSSRQDALRARVAPALAVAEKMQKELQVWSKSVGSAFDELYVPEGEDDREVVENLMRGLPTTTAVQQQQSYALVSNLLRVVRMTVKQKAVMDETLKRECADIERTIARADSRGSMTVQNDFSSAYYDERREIESALHRLSSVNEDNIKSLWDAARGLVARLERIAALRAEHVGTAQEPLVWENKNAVLEGALEAERRKQNAQLGAGPDGRLNVAKDADWNVFGESK